MNMKMIIPMVMIAAMPMGADAQNKSGLCYHHHRDNHLRSG